MHFDAPDNPAVAELLHRQHGIISAAQLKHAGVAVEFARARVRSGRWQRVHRGVYAAFGGPVSRVGTIWAAVLRCGNTAVASHETAAELDGLGEAGAGPVHVTVDATRRVSGRPAGVVVHYAHRLPRTRHPAKSPPRTRIEETIMDLVDRSRTARQASAWILAGVQRRLTTPDQLAAALALRKKIKWRAMAEAMLMDVADGAHSMLEVQHLRHVERPHGLPRGARQRRVSGQRVTWVDVAYDEFATRVELDGRLGHEGDGVFRDRRRDNRGAVGRTWTLRYGHAEVFGTPCEVAAEQAVVLQGRGWAGGPRKCGAGCRIEAAMDALRKDRAA